MNPVIQLTVERGQHLTTAEMFMNAGIVILVVFGVLLLMYILISISGLIIQAITKAGSKKEPEKAPAAAPAAAPAVAAAAQRRVCSAGPCRWPGAARHGQYREASNTGQRRPVEHRGQLV